MHELEVANQIIRIVGNAANDAKKITAINLVIGEMSSIIDESFKESFKILAQDERYNQTKLSFKRIKSTFHCEDCNIDFEKNCYFTCPSCGKVGQYNNDANEFYVESIEVE